MVYMSMHTSQYMYNNPKGNIKTLSKKTDNLVIHYQLGNRQRVRFKQLINIDWLCCIISSLHCINLIHFSPFVKYFYKINLFCTATKYMTEYFGYWLKLKGNILCFCMMIIKYKIFRSKIQLRAVYTSKSTHFESHVALKRRLLFIV